MANNPVVMARRTAAGLVAHAAMGQKEEYDLLFRMYIEDMHEPHMRSIMLLLSAAIGIAAEAAVEDPEWLHELANGLAGV